MSGSNFLIWLVLSTRKCFFTEGGKDSTYLLLNDCNFLNSPCIPLATTDWSVRGEVPSQQGQLHNSLIAKLSHIGTTPILQFFNAFSSCLSQDGYPMLLATLQHLLGYIQIFLHGLALLYFYISYAESKKERN